LPKAQKCDFLPLIISAPQFTSAFYCGYGEKLLMENFSWSAIYGLYSLPAEEDVGGFAFFTETTGESK